MILDWQRGQGLIKGRFILESFSLWLKFPQNVLNYYLLSFIHLSKAMMLRIVFGTVFGRLQFQATLFTKVDYGLPVWQN